VGPCRGDHRLKARSIGRGRSAHTPRSLSTKARRAQTWRRTSVVNRRSATPSNALGAEAGTRSALRRLSSACAEAAAHLAEALRAKAGRSGGGVASLAPLVLFTSGLKSRSASPARRMVPRAAADRDRTLPLSRRTAAAGSLSGSPPSVISDSASGITRRGGTHHPKPDAGVAPV
jgi:hypothetical protein